MEQLVYQLEVTLKDIRPPIWRRFLVPANITFYKLHQVLQIVMGWGDYHLFGFYIDKNIFISIPDPTAPFFNCLNAKRKKLNEYFEREEDKTRYLYDFGDSWEYEIKLKKILSVDQRMKHPVCIKGERGCPPEDCGGTGGYEDLLEIIMDPEHEEYEEKTCWLGDNFDTEGFDIDVINAILKKVKFR